MDNKLYAIWDHKAAYFMPFFLEANDATAIRAVAAVLEDPTHNLSRHATDYSLFYLGEWNNLEGLFKPTPQGRPQHVTDCWTIKAQIEAKNSPSN